MAIFNSVYKSFTPPRLPDAYQEVEYIWGTGTQYIDTWIDYNDCSLPIVEMDFELSAQNRDKWLIWQATSWYWLFWVNNNWDKFAFCWDNSWWRGTVWLTFSTWKHKFTTTSSNWYLDWNVWPVKWWTMYMPSWWWNIYIFKSNWANSEVIPTWTVIIYYFKISNTNSDTLIELIPCYRKSDSVIWMYDLVNDTFYTNSWTWTFTKWPDVN